MIPAGRIAQTDFLFTFLPNRRSDYRSNFRSNAGIVIQPDGN